LGSGWTRQKSRPATSLFEELTQRHAELLAEPGQLGLTSWLDDLSLQYLLWLGVARSGASDRKLHNQPHLCDPRRGVVG